MKVLVLCEYPSMPAGLSTQADLFVRGLEEIGVEVHAVHTEAYHEKEWYYRWLKPDVVVGIGYWGYAPDIVIHPQTFGMRAVPWLVADGYIANYRDVLNRLPLILVTSNWVKEVYTRDGINPSIIEVLPVGCDTDAFAPRAPNDPKIASIRETLGMRPDEVMILTVGGDAASKGGQEVMRALAQVNGRVGAWKYVCKVWPQERTEQQTTEDQRLACQLGIQKNVIFTTSRASRNFMPYLIGACDIYAAPSRLEGFGMPQVEANACGKPVVGIKAMAMLDTQIHGETALLADVAQENRISETILGEDAGFEAGHRVIFDPPRIADYRASVNDLAEHLSTLMGDAELRRRMGLAGRARAVELFDYRAVARRFVATVSRRLFTPRPAFQTSSYAVAK